ncbi:hypothetical protein NUU61_000272 [Penicillium alfredii]|uniref:Zn(2)-C6 fungal-type domain-containing protein n=1 Tax=Penicillium alfredii TaxID=1506179 RepID=A0A9W9G9T6_9EURO|nr:uncharacterized protein NUU61_000272 [Penicillium alfredii]KAJ5114513.1 hypothetical protein NUU61_000272 [Penicillium alfredii]
MPGIPWKSLACANCKKRKVKCDLQQPECARCVKRGTPCPGLDKSRVFFNHTSELSSNANQAVAARSQHARPPTISPSIGTSPEIRNQLYSSFLGAYFPVDIRSPANHDSWHFLMEQFPTLVRKSEMFDRSICALSSVLLGKTNNDARLIQYGIQIYNSALGMLSRTIHRGSPPFDDLIYTTVVFQIYEALFCPSGFAAWMAHKNGTNALLKKYYSQANHGNPLIKAIYRQQQLGAIWYAVGKDPAMIDWEFVTRSFEQDSLDELLKGFIECTFLIHSVNKIEESPHDNRAGSLQRSCLKLEKKLMTWYDDREATIGGRPSPGGRSKFNTLPRSLQAGCHMFPVPYWFASLDTARLHLLYWTALVLVYPLIYRTQVIMGSEDTEAFPSVDLATAEYYANEICRSVPYCLQQDKRIWSGQLLLFPLTWASKFFCYYGYREKYLWCQHVFDALAGLGFGVAQFLKIPPSPPTHSAEGNNSRGDQRNGRVLEEGEQRIVDVQ